MREIAEKVSKTLVCWSRGELDTLYKRHRGFCYNFYKLVEDLDDHLHNYLMKLYRDSWETWEHNCGDPNYAVPGSRDRGPFPGEEEDLWDDSEESMLRKDLARHSSEYLLENFDENFELDLIEEYEPFSCGGGFHE